MKKSAAKTLGAAALGAAFAVAAAGTASATALPSLSVGDVLGQTTGALQGATSQQHMGPEGQQSSDPTAAVTGALTPLTGALNGLGG